MIVSEVGRIATGSIKSVVPYLVTQATSGENPDGNKGFMEQQENHIKHKCIEKGITFDMVLFSLKFISWYEQWEVTILHSKLFDFFVHKFLDLLPHEVRPRPD